MGFLDRVKATVEQTTKTAQDKYDEAQAKRRADALFRELGAWYYASRKETAPDASEHVERLVAELEAHEAEHGPSGTSQGADVAAPSGPSDQPPPAADQPPAGEYTLDAL